MVATIIRKYCGIGLCAVAALAAVKVGDPLPALKGREHGRSASMEQLPEHKPLVILSPTATISASECHELRQAAGRLAGDGVVLVVVTAEPQGCVWKEGVILVSDTAELLHIFPSKGARSDSWRIVIADPYRTVRLVAVVPTASGAITKAAEIAATWEHGRQSFIANCGHCHGDDGADTNYIGIKTLAGIFRRLPPEKILDGGQLFGAVDMSSWSRTAKDALLPISKAFNQTLRTHLRSVGGVDS